MTFAHPWLLLLLASVPALLWLHRRRAPRVVVVASVDPYRAGSRVRAQAERRGPDPLLAALLVAAACLSLAAAGARRTTGTPGVRIVLDETPSMRALAADPQPPSGVPVTVGDEAHARALTLVGDALGDVALSVVPLATEGTLDAIVAAARADGYPGVVLVTDRARPGRDGGVVVGPPRAARANVAVTGAWLDGTRVVVAVRHFGAGPVHFVAATATGPRELELRDGEETTYEVAAPQRGVAATVEIRADDALAADDRIVIRRTGGARRVRFAGDSPRVAAALRALGPEVVESGAADAVVEIGGTLGLDAEPTVHLAPRGSTDFGSGLVLLPSPREVDGAAIVRRGTSDFPVPANSARLVATGRIAPNAGKFRVVETLLEDPAGGVAAKLESTVAVVLDPDDPGSDWHRDGSFVAILGASLDLVTGGPERLVVEDAFPAGESDVAREPVPPPSLDAIRAVARPASSADLAVPLAALGAAAAALAAWLGAHRR